MGDINFYIDSNAYGIVENGHQILLHYIIDEIVNAKNTNDKLITLELNTEKYLSSDVAVKKCEELRDSNKKIVLAYGHFDFFHIGHMRFLELAKQEGDILIVCISPDKDLGSEFDETARLQSISIVPSVDYVMVNLFGDIEQLLKNVSPSIYVKGNEFNLLKDPVRINAFEIERNACKKANVELVCVDYQGESSTDQINTFLSSFTDELQQYLTMFKQRNDLSQLKQVITNCETLKVAVIGIQSLMSIDIASRWGHLQKILF